MILNDNLHYFTFFEMRKRIDRIVIDGRIVRDVSETVLEVRRSVRDHRFFHGDRVSDRV